MEQFLPSIVGGLVAVGTFLVAYLGGMRLLKVADRRRKQRSI